MASTALKTTKRAQRRDSTSSAPVANQERLSSLAVKLCCGRGWCHVFSPTIALVTDGSPGNHCANELLPNASKHRWVQWITGNIVRSTLTPWASLVQRHGGCFHFYKHVYAARAYGSVPHSKLDLIIMCWRRATNNPMAMHVVTKETETLKSDNRQGNHSAG